MGDCLAHYAFGSGLIDVQHRGLTCLVVLPDEMRIVIEPTLWHVAEIIEPTELDTSGQYYAALRKRGD